MGDHAQYDLAARRAAHVLVDLLSVFDEDDLPERAAEMGAAMSLAFRRSTELTRDEIIVLRREFVDHRFA